MAADKKPARPSRRDFISRMTSSAAVVAGAVSLAPMAAHAATESDAAASAALISPPFDDTWTERVMRAKCRAVFDSANVDGGIALTHVTSYLTGFKLQLGLSGADIVPVLVLRHESTWLALNDAMWQKYTVGERAIVKDGQTGKEALRNPFLHVDAGDKSAPITPEASLESLLASGTVILACNRAMTRFSGAIARKVNSDGETILAELRANLAPGVIMQPSGIYAVHRAQGVGCTFIKSS